MTTLAKRVHAYTHDLEQQAWTEYLDTTTSQHPFTYEEIEAWAWARLQHQLQLLNKKKRRTPRPTTPTPPPTTKTR